MKFVRRKYSFGLVIRARVIKNIIIIRAKGALRCFFCIFAVSLRSVPCRLLRDGRETDAKGCFPYRNNNGT